jgi:hypothetical protein
LHKAQLQQGARHVHGDHPGIVVIAQNVSDPNDIQATIYSNPPYRDRDYGLANSRAFIHIEHSPMVNKGSDFNPRDFVSTGS